MRDDFAAFILTHGRPDRVYTYKALKRAGYTGKIYIVIDDEDKTADQYKEIYGDKVLTFSKSEIAKTFDEGDNFNDRRAVIYARNACWDLAEQVGAKYFIQLDDDYTRFDYRFDDKKVCCQKLIISLDSILKGLVGFFINTRVKALAIGQSGDYIGGTESAALKCICTKRKAMNTFICSTMDRFTFVGRINEDVNTYTAKQRSGYVFMSIMGVSILQTLTQTNHGGMTELYVDSGTYIKSFYSVLYAPSCVKVQYSKALNRLHHRVDWNATAPKIIREEHKKR